MCPIRDLVNVCVCVCVCVCVYVGMYVLVCVCVCVLVNMVYEDTNVSPKNKRLKKHTKLCFIKLKNC